MTPILYGHPFSQHSRRVTSLLEEEGIDYEFRMVDLVKGEHVSPSYLAINPNHQVPTLIDGDIKLHESNAILRYLCLKHDLTDWYPSDLKTRATIEQWLDWNQCRLSRTVTDVVLNTVFLGEHGDKAAIERGHKALEELLPILSDGLANTAFIAGDKPSIADISLGANITHLALAGAAPTQPNITHWLGRVMDIEGFRKAMPPKPGQ